jgi:hypothetical protein
MAAFEEMCEAYLRISGHWHFFRYFFKFAYLKEVSRAATIGCANLQMKQDRGNDYIPVSLTSSNSGCHKGWFYLRNNPEFALPAYTRNSIAKLQRNWSDGPAKTEQEKILEDHWVVLGRLRGAKVTLAEVIRQYHARGFVPLRRRPLRLYEMMADRPPWAGTVTAPVVPVATRGLASCGVGDREVNLLVAAITAAPDAGIEKIVSCYPLDTSCLLLC